MSLEENFQAYLKEKYANEEKEQNTETDNPNFRGGFLEFLQKDENEDLTRVNHQCPFRLIEIFPISLNPKI